MVRRHGWQLPAHTFQVVAITVFFLLGVAFYVFFAQFVGSNVLEYAAMAVYTPLALAVFFLYIRSTAIDPADPGIFTNATQKTSFKEEKKHGLSESSLVLNAGQVGVRQSSALSSALHSENKASLAEAGGIKWNDSEDAKKWTSRFSFLSIGCLLCGWLIKDDTCIDEGVPHQPVADEDVLFCTLCNAEVRKFSKHCRSCDKCVDGFDHHCRWLNNCVGRKNYITFVSLMAASLTLLILEWGIGVAVLVRFFVDERGTEKQIIEKLGNRFSRAPYAAVVALCTLISLFASIPLAELFFFHIILIRKGITTYEYVVAMRSQSEAPGISVEGDPQSIPSSPSSSTATGLSRSSSVGLQYKGAWCTPPRVFVEHQDEVIPHLGPGRVPSTVDPDALGAINRVENRPMKRPVRISAWRLAKLNPSEAYRAAAKARESSSVLRPIVTRGPDADYSSSGNASSRSSMSTDLGTRKELKDERMPSPLKSAYPPCHANKDEVEMGTQSRSSYSSPSHMRDSVALSPSPLECRYGLPTGIRISAPVGRVQVEMPQTVTNMPNPRHSFPTYKHAMEKPLRAGTATTNDGSETSGIQNVNDSLVPSNLVFMQPNPVQLNRNIMENKKASVIWDRGAGRYVSTAWLGQAELVGGTTTVPAADDDAEKASSPSHALLSASPRVHTSRNGSPCLPTSVVQHDNLLYTEESIFYGGPLILPAVESTKKDNSPRLDTLNTGTSQNTSADSQVVLPFQPSQETRPLRGLTVLTQSPVFVPRSMQTNTFSHPS